MLLRALVLLFFVQSIDPVLAQPDAHQAEQDPRIGRVLGTISFPTSTQSPEAQAAFIEGMLLLHLFEYPYAEAAFQRAQSLDPDFAMAYWGEAMVHNHPIWDEQDGDKARAVLAKFGGDEAAIEQRLKSDRERDFFRSLFILYGSDGSAKTKAARDLAYEQHYAAMAERYPEDHEVQLFYALSLMGTHAGVRDTIAYMESTAISQRVFYANRQHPGAAHYLIHGVDDPIHAPLGLEAARALYELAPDAGHSLHMTSHIFNALGMWGDSVKANINADRVADAMRAERGLAERKTGHYNFWLLYGLLQQNRVDEARDMLRAAYEELHAAGTEPGARMILDPDRDALGSLVQMWARFLFETGGVDADIMKWEFATAGAFDPTLTILYARGLLSQSRDGVAAHLEDFRATKAELEAAIKAQERIAPSELEYLERLEVIEQQLLANLARVEGRNADALDHAREASRIEGDMPFSFGPPFVDYPSAQLLGEIAAEQGFREEAIAAFREQLRRSRNRRQAKDGLAALLP
ncbi:MAG: hypothetical protein AAFY29_21365 [Pseudomonadota bacterium]